MKNHAMLRSALIAFATLAAGVLSLALSAGDSAAQGIAAVVNGTPITTLEVSQRRAFIRLTQHKDKSAREVADDLIDEALIMKEAARRGVAVKDADVDARFAAVAQGMKISTAQLEQGLAHGGTSARTFKQTIRAQLLYHQLVQSRFSSASISEQAIAEQMAQRKNEAEDSFRATLRQVIFVLPKNASAAQVAQRKREAEALRSRFHSCDEGLKLARGLRDVAVKDPVTRNSAQLGKAFRDALVKLKIGQTMPPERTALGIELVAFCDKQETHDDSGLRQEVQAQLADEKFKVDARKFILDLRQRAIIQYR
jgi:peptidyl-prolyl cis-trans isomerase SurA